ncbi:MAG: nickel pincer cofactor biosynthesis protein LarB, partial [Planctomycetaceae bacterium]
MNESSLRSLLQSFQAGEVALDDALARLSPRRTAATSDSRIDLDRPRRCGFPEVVFCQGKTAAAVVEIFETLIEHGQEPLGTRVSPEQADALRQRFPEAIHNAIGRTVRVELHQVEKGPG